MRRSVISSFSVAVTFLLAASAGCYTEFGAVRTEAVEAAEYVDEEYEDEEWVEEEEYDEVEVNDYDGYWAGEYSTRFRFGYQYYSPSAYFWNAYYDCAWYYDPWICGTPYVFYPWYDYGPWYPRHSFFFAFHFGYYDPWYAPLYYPAYYYPYYGPSTWYGPLTYWRDDRERTDRDFGSTRGGGSRTGFRDGGASALPAMGILPARAGSTRGSSAVTDRGRRVRTRGPAQVEVRKSTEVQRVRMIRTTEVQGAAPAEKRTSGSARTRAKSQSKVTKTRTPSRTDRGTKVTRSPSRRSSPSSRPAVAAPRSGGRKAAAPSRPSGSGGGRSRGGGNRRDG